jgi:uncharacterized membrane protein
VIGLETVYRLAGLVLGAAAVATWRDRAHASRRASTAFWGIYALTLLAGSYLPDFVNGCLVIGLGLVGGLARFGRGDYRTTTTEERSRSAARLGNRLFVPALLVPGGTVAITLLAKRHAASFAFVDAKNASLVGLGLSAAGALAIALVLVRERPRSAVDESRRLLDLVGWAAVLPQMLAALGVLFATAGVGDRIAELLGRVLPLSSPLIVVVTYTAGMALFTVVLGNAFAAFPIMTAAVGLPLLVKHFGADPAAIAAIGMLSGFCGTLMTPMAANFNIVPAALLELPDDRAIMKVQAPTALLLLLVNTSLMYVLVLRR